MAHYTEVMAYEKWIHEHWVGALPNPKKIPAEMFQLGCLVREVRITADHIELVRKPGVSRADVVRPAMKMASKGNLPFRIV